MDRRCKSLCKEKKNFFFLNSKWLLQLSCVFFFFNISIRPRVDHTHSESILLCGNISRLWLLFIRFLFEKAVCPRTFFIWNVWHEIAFYSYGISQSSAFCAGVDGRCAVRSLRVGENIFCHTTSAQTKFNAVHANAIDIHRFWLFFVLIFFFISPA